MRIRVLCRHDGGGSVDGPFRWVGARHNQSRSRKASSLSAGRKRPGLTSTGVVRARARSLMAMSAPSWSSATRRSRHTSPASSPSSGCATAPRRWCSPTKADSCAPPAADAREHRARREPADASSASLTSKARPEAGANARGSRRASGVESSDVTRPHPAKSHAPRKIPALALVHEASKQLTGSLASAFGGERQSRRRSLTSELDEKQAPRTGGSSASAMSARRSPAESRSRSVRELCRSFELGSGARQAIPGTSRHNARIGISRLMRMSA